jgi:hypothetical protein
MEPEGSLPYSQVPATRPYPEPTHITVVTDQNCLEKKRQHRIRVSEPRTPR